MTERDALAARPVNAQLLAIATGQVQHIYSENCPDPVSWPNSRDPECPACQAIIAAEAQQAGPVQLTEALQKRCYMFSEKHLSGHRIVLGFEAQSDADEVVDQLAKPRAKEALDRVQATLRSAGKVALPAHVFRELVNDLRDIARTWHSSDQLRERISGRLRNDVSPAGVIQPRAKGD